MSPIESILSISYLSSWLVVFIGGWFLIYKSYSSNSLIASFYFVQTNRELVILAISKYLSFTISIYRYSINYYRLKVSIVRLIENII